MTLGALLVGMALLLVITSLVVRPLMDHPASPAHRPEADPPLARQAVLASLRDLDFDHRLGRIWPEDYASTRATLLAQAAEAMTDEHGGALEEILEEKVRRIRQRLDQGGPSSCPACGNRLTAGDRFCSLCGRGLDLACPTCGGTTSPQDVFCVECGTRLQRAGQAAA